MWDCEGISRLTTVCGSGQVRCSTHMYSHNTANDASQMKTPGVSCTLRPSYPPRRSPSYRYRYSFHHNHHRRPPRSLRQPTFAIRLRHPAFIRPATTVFPHSLPSRHSHRCTSIPALLPSLPSYLTPYTFLVGCAYPFLLPNRLYTA